MKFYNKWPFHLGLILFSIVADQLTKFWALARFTNETGAPNHDVINVIGELVRFQLVFNKGAAFSSRPQDLMPFLPPWLFFLLISIVATVVLLWFYKSIDKRDWMSRLGVVMILGGAVVPPLQGLLADIFNPQLAFAVPLACYAYLAWYGFVGCKPKKTVENQ